MSKDKNELEIRNYPALFDIRDDDNDGVVVGRPIVFDSMTDLGYFNEIIERGALDNADLRDIRLCLNHDTSYVYARSRNNNESSTMQVTVSDDGMEIKAALDIESSPKAQDLYSAIKRKDIDKMSFMFSVAEDKWEDLDSDHPTRHITSIASVVEVSAVTWPAYEATEIFARGKEALEKARSTVETARQQRKANAPEGADKNTDALALAKAKLNLITGG